MTKKPLSVNEIKSLPHNYVPSIEVAGGCIGYGKSFICSSKMLSHMYKSMVVVGLSRVRLSKSKVGSRFVKTVQYVER